MPPVDRLNPTRGKLALEKDLTSYVDWLHQDRASIRFGFGYHPKSPLFHRAGP